MFISVDRNKVIRHSFFLILVFSLIEVGRALFVLSSSLAFATSSAVSEINLELDKDYFVREGFLYFNPKSSKVEEIISQYADTLLDQNQLEDHVKISRPNPSQSCQSNVQKILDQGLMDELRSIQCSLCRFEHVLPKKNISASDPQGTYQTVSLDATGGRIEQIQSMRYLPCGHCYCASCFDEIGLRGDPTCLHNNSCMQGFPLREVLIEKREGGPAGPAYKLNLNENTLKFFDFRGLNLREFASLVKQSELFFQTHPTLEWGNFEGAKLPLPLFKEFLKRKGERVLSEEGKGKTDLMRAGVVADFALRLFERPDQLNGEEKEILTEVAQSLLNQVLENQPPYKKRRSENSGKESLEEISSALRSIFQLLPYIPNPSFHQEMFGRVLDQIDDSSPQVMGVLAKSFTEGEHKEVLLPFLPKLREKIKEYLAQWKDPSERATFLSQFFDQFRHAETHLDLLNHALEQMWIAGEGEQGEQDYISLVLPRTLLENQGPGQKEYEERLHEIALASSDAYVSSEAGTQALALDKYKKEAFSPFPILETKVTKNGDVFHKVLVDKKLDPSGEAWMDPEGVIWLDIVKNGDGSFKLAKNSENEPEAKKHCEDLGKQLGFRVELPSATPLKNDQGGYITNTSGYYVPDARSDYGRLLSYMKDPQNQDKYTPQIMTHLGTSSWLWSSSVHERNPDNAFIFSGNHLGSFFSGSRFNGSAFRCVVRSR